VLNINDKKQKTLIFASVGLIILIIYFQFLLRPRIKSLLKVFPEVSQTFKKVSQAKEDIANVSKFEKKTEKLKQKISFYEKKMATEKEIPIILGELSKCAQATNVKILGILPLEKIEEDKESEAKFEDDSGGPRETYWRKGVGYKKVGERGVCSRPGSGS